MYIICIYVYLYISIIYIDYIICDTYDLTSLNKTMLTCCAQLLKGIFRIPNLWSVWLLEDDVQKEALVLVHSFRVWGGVHHWKLTWNTQKLVVCIDVSPFPRGYVQVSCWFFGCVCCYMLVSLYISGRRFSSILHQGNLMLHPHKRNLPSIMFFCLPANIIHV